MRDGVGVRGGRLVAVLLAGVLVVGGLPGPGAATARGTSTGTGAVDSPTGKAGAVAGDAGAVESAGGAAASAPEGAVVEAATVDRTPSRPGSVALTVTYRLPDSVTDFEARLPADTAAHAAVLDSEDVRTNRGADGLTLTWRGGTRSPSVTLRLETTTDRFSGGVAGVDRAEWAFVAVPWIDATWQYRGADLAFREETRVAGTGYASEEFAYAGPHETVTRAGEDETVRVVVPAAASPRASPEAAAETLAGASRRLDVGARADAVTAFVLPASVDSGGTVGLSAADGFWVRGDEPLGGHDSAWLHEYVHTRQAFGTTPGTAWLTEASAEYYAAVLAHEGGRASAAGVAASMRRAASGVLAEPDTWQRTPGTPEGTQYGQGQRALAALDARVRAASNGTATLADVLARLNDERGPLTPRAVRETASAVAGTSLDGWFRQYVQSRAAPAPPANPSAYATAADEAAWPPGTTGVLDAAAFALADAAGDGDDDGLPGTATGLPLLSLTPGSGAGAYVTLAWFLGGGAPLAAWTGVPDASTDAGVAGNQSAAGESAPPPRGGSESSQATYRANSRAPSPVTSARRNPNPLPARFSNQ